MQFIVIGKDGKDDQALERRMAAREAHIKYLNEATARGEYLYAAAITDESGKMCGSILITEYESREKLDEWLRCEPYVTGKVWEEIEIHPAKVPDVFAKK